MNGTIAYPVFDGQVTFHMRMPTLKSTRMVLKTSEVFERVGILPETNGEYPAKYGHESTFALLVSYTDSITFDLTDDSHQALKEFQAFSKKLSKLNLEDDASVTGLWEARLDIHDQIISAWIAAYDTAHNENIINDPASLPEEALTDEQKEELVDPESPLD